MGHDKQLLKGTISIMVLRLLLENDMYGYQMIKELERRSVNVFSITEGALYPILHKLENDKHILSYWEEGPSKRKRKYYHLTPGGAKFCQSKMDEWNNFSDAVNTVLSGGSDHAKMSFGLFRLAVPAYS